MIGDLLCERLKVAQEEIFWIVIQNSADEIDQCLLVLEVWNGPPGVDHGLAHGFDHKLLDTARVASTNVLAYGPGTNQSLIEERFFVPLRCAHAFHAATMNFVPSAPVAEASVPFLRHFRKNIDASARILRTFRVMRHRAIHGERPFLMAILHEFVEPCD